MSVKHWVSRLDRFHPHHSQQILAERDLFGVQLPKYVIFHSIFGYILLGVAFSAMVLRIPLRWLKEKRWLHPYVGYVWVFGTVWMAITSIWCVRGTLDWDVVAFFIFSMYGTIQAGWVSIKAYQHKRGKVEDSLTTASSPAKQPLKIRVLKWLHATLMIYSFIMLLGAGISFPFRANEDYVRSGTRA